MAKWEYRVCAVEPGASGQVEEHVNAKLKSLGEDGWRFVETFYAQHSLPLLLFKRQPKATKAVGYKSPRPDPLNSPTGQS
jgi:hypothetical protein